MNHVSTEALNIGRKIHPGMGMFVRLLLIIVLPLSFFNLVSSNFSKMILIRFMFMFMVFLHVSVINYRHLLHTIN